MQLLSLRGPLVSALDGAFGVFYRRCLRSLLGVGSTLRNEIVFVLSGRFPLELYIGKSVHRMVASFS